MSTPTSGYRHVSQHPVLYAKDSNSDPGAIRQGLLYDPHSALGLFCFTILTLTFLVSSTLLSVTGFGHGENRCPGGPFSRFFRSSVFPSLCNALMIGLHFFRPRPSHPRRPFLSVAGNIPAAPHPCHQTASPKGQYIHSKFSFCCGEIHIA